MLRSHDDGDVAGQELEDTILLVKTFCFHLLQLDVRQVSLRHREAMAEVLRLSLDCDFPALDELGRLDLLSKAFTSSNALQLDEARLSEGTRETLRVFQLIAHMRRILGPDCFGRCVISMTHSASHVMEAILNPCSPPVMTARHA